ncbi:MAG TPA: winged helix DNA-binding domain-containing protein [Candidatus Dormibacteraeota bacterium]|nr:winged helix DNA-binding domain-containing protein [Candidatus Dormibacteraeota bacterium]
MLARQFLLERSSLPLVPTLERVGGLQTQYAPSGYVGLWSRMPNFRRDALTSALEERGVIQGTLLRSTIHMVSARDYWLFLAAVRQSRQDWWRRVTQKAFGDVDMDAAAAVIRKPLEAGPQRAGDLKELLSGRGFPRATWTGVGIWVDMVRVPPSGTWDQRRADLYALAEQWAEPAAPTEAAGLEHVVRRYLGAFGPASVREIADWAGIPHPTLLPVIDRLSLRRFRDEKGKELVDLQRAALPAPQTPAPVRFLPTWDATLLVHARRTQILPEPYRPLVFNTRTPHSVPTFLVDGAVAGTWRYEGGRVEVKPFEPLPKAARRDVDDEAKRLEAFHK